MPRKPTLAARYMNEEVPFGGYLTPRHEVIRYLRDECKATPRMIDVYLIGQAHAAVLRASKPAPATP